MLETFAIDTHAPDPLRSTVSVYEPPLVITPQEVSDVTAGDDGGAGVDAIGSGATGPRALPPQATAQTLNAKMADGGRIGDRDFNCELTDEA